MTECLCGKGSYEVATFEGETHWVRCKSCGARTPPMSDFQSALDAWERMQNMKGVRDKLRVIVRDIYERREFRPCWWEDDEGDTGDCGNWPTCNEKCSLCRLGRMVGMAPSEGGEVHFED